MSNHRAEWTDAVKKLQMMPQKRSKYGAVKVTVDGIVFDSKREAQRYHELKLLQKSGKIDALELQPEYLLLVRNGGGEVSLGIYRADFRYWENGNVEVEDAKGFKTPLYRWKKKHVEAQYGIQIREV